MGNQSHWRDLLPLAAMMGICFWTAYFHRFFTAAMCFYLLARVIVLHSQERERVMRRNYRRLEEMERALLMDPLTGLYNHMGFYHILEDQVRESVLSEHPLSLVVIDIDNFKKVNDTYGHENGNLVLMKIAELLKGICTPNAYACRYGGEEFTLIFPGYSENQTKTVMEGVRLEFFHTAYPFLPEGGISFSSGIRAYSGQMSSSQAFFEGADQAMYYAKRQGKNRVYVLWDEEFTDQYNRESQ
ncbi:MAG: GGDEF domain-containing protein [Lachnospiraceae bacterium]